MDFTDMLKLEKAYEQKLIELKIETKKLPNLYKDAAEKECLYREAKSKAYLRLLADDQKVTVIPTLAAGKTSEHRLMWKISEGMLKSTRENINRLRSGVEACRTFVSVAKSEINIR